MTAVPKEKTPSSPDENGGGEPVKPMQIPNKEWDMCVQKAVKTVGLGVIVGAVMGFLVGADLPLMWGTGLTVAWSIKRCRALLRDGIITPEMEKERKRLEKLERERKKLEKDRESEQKSKMDRECCRKLAELEEIMHRTGGELKTIDVEEKEKCEATEVDQNDKQQPRFPIDGSSDDCPLTENDSTASDQQGTEIRKDLDDDEEPCDGMENDTLENREMCPDEEQNTQDENDCQVYENGEGEDCEEDEENVGKIEGKFNSSGLKDVDEECEDEEEPEDCTEPEMEKGGEFYGEEPCEYEDEDEEVSKIPPTSTRSYNSFLQRPTTSRASYEDGATPRSKMQPAEYPVTVVMGGKLFSAGKFTVNPIDPLTQRGFHDKDSVDEEECEEEEEDEAIAEKTENLTVYDDENESVEDVDATLSEDDLDAAQRDVQILGFKQKTPKPSNEMQNDGFPFPMSLPSLENFHKKPKSSFKWPPLTSSIIVKPKRQPVCSCEMHKYPEDQTGGINSD